MPLIKKKILVVDDEPDILTLMEWQLMMSGYDVVTARNGAEGFHKAKESNPDLIILDMIMPVTEVNGVQMNELLKKDPATKQIPIVFFASVLDEEEREDESGNVMLSKTIGTEKLLSRIKQIIGP